VDARQEIPKSLYDKQFYIKSSIIIFSICFAATLILIFGFLFLELGLIELISNGDQAFGIRGVIAGVIATIIAPFLLFFGYPILIHLYKRSMV